MRRSVPCAEPITRSHDQEVRHQNGIILFEYVRWEATGTCEDAKEELNTMMSVGEMCGAVVPWYERSGVDGCDDGR